MSELQLGLIGLGATAVVGVLAYNKWQEHRHRKLAEQMLAHGHADVLLDQHQDAETFSPAPAPVVFVEDEHEQRLVPMMSTERASSPGRQEPSARMEPKFLDDDSSFVESQAPAAEVEAMSASASAPILAAESSPVEPFLAEPEAAFAPSQPPSAPAPEAAPESGVEPMLRANAPASPHGISHF